MLKHRGLEPLTVELPSLSVGLQDRERLVKTRNLILHVQRHDTAAAIVKPFAYGAAQSLHPASRPLETWTGNHVHALEHPGDRAAC